MSSTESPSAGVNDSDAYLLRRYVQHRSEPDFTRLVERHLKLVYFSALRRVGDDAHLAEEITQRVFLDLSRKATSLLEREDISGWLFTSTRFASVQAVRAARRRRFYEQESRAMEELHPDPKCAWETVKPVLDSALDELNTSDRDVVLLRFFEGQSHAEIAQRLSISADASRMRVDRALEKLRVVLGRRGVTSTAAALAALLGEQSAVAAPAGLASTVVTSVFAAPVGTLTLTVTFWKWVTAGSLGLVGVGAAVHYVHSSPPERQAASPVAIVRPPASVSGDAARATAPQRTGTLRSGDIRDVQITPAEFRNRMRTDPAYRARIIARTRKRLDLFYGPLFEKLQLTGPDLETFKDLLVAKQRVGLESNEIGLELGYPTPEYPQLFDASVRTGLRSLEETIRMLLSESQYAEYRRYGEDLTGWTVVTALRQELGGGTERLSQDQAERLVAVFHRHLPRAGVMQSINILYGSGLFSTIRANPMTDPVMNEAAVLLSPGQLSALRKIRSEWGMLPHDPTN